MGRRRDPLLHLAADPLLTDVREAALSAQDGAEGRGAKGRPMTNRPTPRPPLSPADRNSQAVGAQAMSGLFLISVKLIYRSREIKLRESFSAPDLDF